ncbi:MAG: HAD-IIB family hydrolase [Bryobacterales bacterium]|nr:HAD-IIB family hydrolase [Bryobacteraceae bacterium]MDW8129742.1 HAD-IIB family hydrolase [Bryobacterales bacterium]
MVFSDLDGTLLDAEGYDFGPAAPALEALARRGIPIVLVSSKTRREIEYWRRRLSNGHPFVVENGGAIYVPEGYFPFALERAVRRDGYEVLELGRPHAELVRALDEAARETRTPVLAFHRMTIGEIRRRTRLPPALARLARQREYDEPFQLPARAPADPLLRALERRGLRWTRGGGFYHVTGHGGKAPAVEILVSAYRRACGRIRTIGLGDAWNDLEYLRLMDIPIVVAGPAAHSMRSALPRARLTEPPGPAGWSRGVLEALASHGPSEVVP